MFYRAYVEEAFTYEWIRIYMFAGLAGEDLNRRYITLLERTLLLPLCREMRAAAGVDACGDEEISSRELEAAWHIHAAVFYYIVRKHIYAATVDPDLDGFIVDTVDRTLDGTLEQLKRQFGSSKP